MSCKPGPTGAFTYLKIYDEKPLVLMAKDPATLWYWNDWHSGTILFSRFLKGCYMDLLHAQFNNGRLSLEEIKTCLGSDFGQSWPTLQKKFKQDENGLFFNERAEQEKQKRAAYSESRRKNRTEKTHDVSYDKHMKPHMENRNKNENRIDNWDSIKTNFLNAYEWKEDFCRKKNIQMPDLEKLMAEFIGDIELGEEFKKLSELKSHFKNKFNKNGTHKQTLGTSESRVDKLKKWGG